MSQGERSLGTVETDVPARLDRLPWARWHWTVLLGLGTVWILDGLEVTIVGALAERLTEPGSGLELSDTQVGLAASMYVAGAVLGALLFGYLTDRLGRKKLFLITLGLYLAATTATAFSFDAWFFIAMRFLTGAGIGGEYAAINSAIDELVPARMRATVSLAVNGSYWGGAAVGAGLTLLLLDPAIFTADLGWRIAFGLGAVLGLAILVVRRSLPESPRWLYTHGRNDEAEELVARIEHDIEEQTGERLGPVDDTLRVQQRRSTGFGEIARTVLRTYPRRTVLGLALFVGQAFLYNAVYFTFALVLSTFFQVPSALAGLYLIPLALGSLIGPLVLGRLFDTVGRRTMISVSYLGSGFLLVGTAWLFAAGVLGAWTLAAAWAAIFFFASSGASAAYLTVSEIFPMEIRAMCIALFYAVGTGLGGIAGPVLFAALVESGSASAVAVGYYIGAGMMILAGIAELVLGVEAAQRSLEDVAAPLSAQDGGGGAGPDGASVSSRAATRSGFAPLPSLAQHTSSRPADDAELDRELGAILQALEDGPLARSELRLRVHGQAWGPGRFSGAVRHGLAAGVLREESRNTLRRAY
ncbi:MFS transporter [Pseudonocardia sp. TRM90224]|uniref:MFS transporter n=1 Tax=Pseudonocardia sp. TRM90224 TaxID=2812678 RepID=UPI001E37450A|nr:MFS transporter [Pseudonocardia sp. TRM90224]